MRKYCGIDLGCDSTAICIVDESGKVQFEGMCETEESALKKIFSSSAELQCVVEASPLAEWLCGVVESAGQQINILDPRQGKAVTHSKKKTDKVDAQKLAQLSRTGWYNVVHRKSGQSRELRSFMTARNQLVKMAQQAASSIRGILRAHGIKLAAGSGQEFEKEVCKALRTAVPMLRRAIDPLLCLWKEAHDAEKAMYKVLPKVTKSNPVVELLQSVPGVGPATAAVFAATIDDPKRFSSAEKVASYIGLVPRIHQSGETEYRGRITKEGDRMLRCLLVEAAGVLLSRVGGSHRVKEWGLKLKEAKGTGKARVAVARKLACLLYRVWISGKPYQCSELSIAA